MWLQWLLEDQLTAAQTAARAAGMPIGIVHDLAVGVHPDGADAWALRDVLAVGCSVGAPPDAFNQVGQNWSQPPLHPERLAEVGLRPVPRPRPRRAPARGWAARRPRDRPVPHVVGARGPAGAAGTYVRYDHEALVGILALEAHRAGAVVIGEDLGVVEPWVREHLAQRGLLGTSITWFEKGWSGEPLAPEHWREACLGAVTTHDLPPTAGYLRGEHLAIRERLGLLTRSVEEERAADAADQAAVLEACASRACSRPPGTASPTSTTWSSRSTRSSPVRPAGCSASPCRTRSVTVERSTSRAPTRSTRTGGSRSPTAPAPSCSSRTCAARAGRDSRVGWQPC